MTNVPRALVALLLVVLAPGCLVGEGADPTLGLADLPSVVLTGHDMEAFSLFDAGRQSRSDQPGGARTALDRFGRLGGWKTRFKRSGNRETAGLLVVESRADVFGGADGAREELRAAREDLNARAGRVLDAPALGDEAVVYTERQGQGEFAVRHFVIAWRVDNLVAQLSGNGFEGKTRLDDALALARAQQRRISAVASS